MNNRIAPLATIKIAVLAKICDISNLDAEKLMEQKTKRKCAHKNDKLFYIHDVFKDALKS